MAIECVVCTLNNKKLEKLNDVIELDSLESFATNEANEKATILLTRNSSISHIVNQSKIFYDAGGKHPSRTLKQCVLDKGTEVVPCLKTPFSELGRIDNSIVGLIGHIKKSNKKRNGKFFILGVTSELFRKLSQSIPAASIYTHVLGATPNHPARTEGSSEISLELANRLPNSVEIPVKLYEDYIGESIECENARRLAMMAVSLDKPVLLHGEPGTGKSILAKYIHKLGGAPGIGPFVHVPCDEIPADELDSELFGYVKGAFPGAKVDKEGLWKSNAQHGTLFLDEIGVLTLDQQKKILRALKTRKIRKVGSREDETVNPRIITATNRNLDAMVHSGKFLADLYEHILTFRIELPPLRAHSYDIPLIAQQLWNKIVKEKKSKLAYPLSHDFKNALREYAWPGNVRLLRAMLTHLYELYETANPSPELLYLVMRRNGQLTIQEEKQRSTPQERIDLHRLKCLEQLKKVSEVVRACETTIRPLIFDNAKDDKTYNYVVMGLNQRYYEFNQLCEQPDLFYDDVLYDMVHSIKGRLRLYISKLETDPEGAINLWKTAAQPEISNVRKTLFASIRELMKH